MFQEGEVDRALAIMKWGSILGTLSGVFLVVSLLLCPSMAEAMSRDMCNCVIDDRPMCWCVEAGQMPHQGEDVDVEIVPAHVKMAHPVVRIGNVVLVQFDGSNSATMERAAALALITEVKQSDMPASQKGPLLAEMREHMDLAPTKVADVKEEKVQQYDTCWWPYGFACSSLPIPPRDHWLYGMPEEKKEEPYYGPKGFSGGNIEPPGGTPDDPLGLSGYSFNKMTGAVVNLGPNEFSVLGLQKGALIARYLQLEKLGYDPSPDCPKAREVVNVDPYVQTESDNLGLQEGILRHLPVLNPQSTTFVEDLAMEGRVVVITELSAAMALCEWEYNNGCSMEVHGMDLLILAEVVPPKGAMAVPAAQPYDRCREFGIGCLPKVLMQ